MELPFFGKKKKGEETAKGRGYVPLDRIRELMGRGFSEIDTIDTLRREGFSPEEIDQGLEQVIKEGAVGGMPMESRSPSDVLAANNTQAQSFQSLGQTYDQSQQGPTPTFPPRPMGAAPPASAPFQQSLPPKKAEPEFKLPTIEELSGKTKEKTQQLAVPETSLPDEYYQGYPTEEYIDYVIQEHMGEINQRVSGFSMRQAELEKRIIEMNERLKDIAKVRSGEQQQIINKIDSFTETVNDVNMRTANLEKAFKETLPALIESVRALSDLVQMMKREA
jgi:hypothetical protein